MTIKKLKHLSVFCLMLCFFLPLSQCTRQSISPPPESISQSSTIESQAPQKLEVVNQKFIPITSIDFDDPLYSIMIVLVFFFTLPFIYLHRIIKQRTRKLLMIAVEILAAGYSAYMLAMIVILFRDPLIAGYFALASIFTYTLIIIIQFIKTFRKRVADATNL